MTWNGRPARSSGALLPTGRAASPASSSTHPPGLAGRRTREGASCTPAASSPPRRLAALALAATLHLGSLREVAAAAARHAGTAAETASDEDFWAMVQQAFTVDRSILNLNNGGVSPSPAMV